MSEEPTRNERVAPKGEMYVKINSQEVRTLFEKIQSEIDYIVKDMRKDKLQETLNLTAMKIREYIGLLSAPHISSMLGVIFPSVGADKVYSDRVVQIIRIAMEQINDIHREIDDTLETIIATNRNLTDEERKKILKSTINLVNSTILLHIAVSELANRLLTVMTIGSRSDTRPPLVNAMFGYDRL